MNIGAPSAMVSPGFEQPIRLKRFEDVAHRRGAALDGVEIELPLRLRLPAHGPLQVLVDDALVVHEHPVGNRVVVPDDTVDEFVNESVGGELELLDGKCDCRPEEIGAGHFGVLGEPSVEPPRHAARSRHATDASRQLHCPSAFNHCELAEQEEPLARCRSHPVRIAPPSV